MRTETITRTLYKYDELSETAKQNAIERFSDINLDFNWWEGCESCAVEDLKEMGIEVDLKNPFSFDIYRAWYFCMHNPIIRDPKKFLDKSLVVIKHGRKFIEESLTIATQTYGYHKECNRLDLDTRCNRSRPRFDKYLNEIQEKLDQYLGETLEGFLKNFRDEYAWLGSKEAIEETILANDYEFDENGNLPRY